ncbi:hypothetical protein Nepgr_007797 [Nepenthes gracilis]|uniref:Uncharacterized protein n=1 Tax=Nepenthes gracilis TaxID=150966 RepID=A0AAD3S8F1_NEPGR|nr:hypothetical protein Nepgr_007797 [Nepenthes gracilis]
MLGEKLMLYGLLLGQDSDFILAGSLLLDFAAELVSASVGDVVLATAIHSFYLMMTSRAYISASAEYKAKFCLLPDLACGGCRFGLRLDGLTDVDSFAGSIAVLREAGLALLTRHIMCRLGQEVAALDLQLNCRFFGKRIKCCDVSSQSSEEWNDEDIANDPMNYALRLLDASFAFALEGSPTKSYMEGSSKEPYCDIQVTNPLDKIGGFSGEALSDVDCQNLGNNGDLEGCSTRCDLVSTVKVSTLSLMTLSSGGQVSLAAFPV